MADISNDRDERPKQLAGPLKFIVILLVAIAAGFAGGYFQAELNGSGGSNTEQIQQAVNNESELITEIAKEVGQSVVSVDVLSRERQQTFFGPSSVTRASAGTGFILNQDGIVVTNRHVIPDGVRNVSVTLSDGTELGDVTVIGKTAANDPLDIAFLKINDKKGKTFQPAKLGDSTQVEVGQKVIAIGNALGQFQNTVTSGIISGYGRSVQAESAQGIETLQNLFQTDASINQGNSGGPLVNMDGEVIGINTAIAAGGAENIGFAIPISDVQGIIRSVLEEGKLQRPFLGIRYVTLTDDIAFRLNLDTKRGAYIQPAEDGQDSIIKGSAAAKAGLQEKDIIVRVNDIEINDRNTLASALGRFRVGDKITLTVVRDGQTSNIDITLEAAPTE